MTITEEVREANNNLAGKTVKFLNGIGKIRREEALGTGGVWDIVETKYNKLGEIWKQSRPFRAGETPVWRETIYDEQGRTKEQIEPDGSTTRAFYNEMARPSAATNLPGNTIRAVDAWGRERWGRYDQQGRLVEVVEPNPNGNGSVFAPGSLQTKYTYNTLGKLVKIEQGEQIREFKYDSLGRLTRQKLAEQTATLNDAGQFVGANGTGATWSEAFVYDTRSNLIQKTDARGVRTNFSYQLADGGDDPLNRLQAVSYDLSGPTESNLTIHAAPTVSYSYINSGDKTRLSQIRTDGILTENFAYDVEGRISDYTQIVDYRQNYPMVTSYLYDSLDRVTDIRYPAQYGLAGSPRKLIQHSFDIAGRLSSLKVGGTEVAGNIVYNAADQTESIKIGASGANQVTETYQYDNLTGLLTNQKVQKSGQTLLDLSYDYQRNNSVGNQNGKTGHLTKIINNLDNNKNREYEFDALGRLTKAKGGNNGSLWQQNYSYDRYGNRTNVTASGVAADNSPIPVDGIPNLTYNSQNNRITTSGFEYDSAGNQTRSKAEDGSWLKYEYDAANRLRIVKKNDNTLLQSFNYGSTNQRLMDLDYTYGYLKIFASNNGTTFSEYTEFAGAIPTWTKSYIHLGNNLLSTVSPNGGGGEITEYNHPDRLGTRTITNQTAGTSYEQTTLPFGTALNAESTGSTSQRFTSYERSARTGLDYAVNRTYDSKQGRFTQIDPIGMKATNLDLPQTLNLYTYCGNDPVNHIDPDGLFFKWLGKLFSKIGRFLNRILGNIVVQIALTVLAAIVSFGTSLIATLSILMPALTAPTWLTIASWVATGASWASRIGTVLEISGLLLQGKFKQFGKIVGMAFVGALVGVIEDSIRNGFLEGLKNGKPFSGAWKGFKKGLGYVFESFKRFGTKKWWEGFIPIYGFFCGPGWGIPNSVTSGETPVDGLDKACKIHDEAYRRAGGIKHDRTLADLKLVFSAATASVRSRFVDRFFGSGYRIGDVYRTTVVLTFPFVIGGRYLRR